MTRTLLARNLALAGLLALLLAACSLIPPQNIGDPFGLDERPVTLDATTGLATGLAPTQFTDCDGVDGTHCVAFGPATFDDPDLPAVAASLIAGFEVDAGLQATIRVTGAAPGQVTVNAFALTLRIRDASTDDAVEFSARVTPASPVVFALQGDGSYQAGDVAPLRMTVAVAGGDLGTVKDILTGGGSNEASGLVVLDVSEDGLETIDVTLVSEGTTVSF
jgi:hypothetical protein